MYNILIIGDMCIGCRYCAIMCPCEVLDVRSDVLAFVAEPEKCDGCRICEDKCPEHAITVIEK